MSQKVGRMILFQDEKDKDNSKSFQGINKRDYTTRPKLTPQEELIMAEIRTLKEQIEEKSCGHGCIVRPEYVPHVNKPFDAIKEIGSNDIETGIIRSRDTVKAGYDMSKSMKYYGRAIVGALLVGLALNTAALLFFALSTKLKGG